MMNQWFKGLCPTVILADISHMCAEIERKPRPRHLLAKSRKFPYLTIQKKVWEFRTQAGQLAAICRGPVRFLTHQMGSGRR